MLVKYNLYTTSNSLANMSHFKASNNSIIHSRYIAGKPMHGGYEFVQGIETLI